MFCCSRARTQVTRPRFRPPPGRLTIRQAARRARISYHLAYARITSGVVPSRRTDGVYTIAEADVSRLRSKGKQKKGQRIAVQVRISMREHLAWQRAARGAGFRAVSSWLRDLGQKAAAGDAAGPGGCT